MSTESDLHSPAEIPSPWATFFQPASRREFFASWLELQLSLIPQGLRGVLVLKGESSESFVPVATWPPADTEAERLADICERVLEERVGLVAEALFSQPGAVSGKKHYSVGFPLQVGRRLLGVVAVEVSVADEGQLRTVMHSLQWGAGWLEVDDWRLQGETERHHLAGMQAAINLLATILVEETSSSADLLFVTELATLLQCDRVTLGVVKKGRAKVIAISHSAHFGERMNISRAVAEAMDEAILQGKEILYPHTEGTLVTRAHEQLMKDNGAVSLFTLPLFGGGKYYSALTLERDRAFCEEDLHLCRCVCSLAGLSLENRRLNDHSIFIKIGDALLLQLSRLFGPKYLGRKLLAVGLVTVALFLAVATGEYRLSADSVLEGSVRRVLAAPFNGYIREAPVRAGDIVAKDEKICSLDDRELRLERLNWLGQRSQYQRQYMEALANHERAQMQIINAQLEQANAQLQLVEGRLERTVLRAPFKALVVNGDLSQQLGGLVQQGETLFEIAPLEEYRLILKVDERRIGDVRVGQAGRLLLTSLPAEYYDFTVERITSIPTAEEGRNFFRVEAQLAKISPRLRPGMEGVGKISIDRRKFVSIWTRDFVEWLRLWLWSWWP